MIRLAKDIGADYVKFQCYLPESLTIDSDKKYFKITDKHSPWWGMTLWEIYQKSYTPREWFPIIIDECKKVGINLIVTPYCTSDLDFLQSLDCPAYKISAFEAMDMVFVKDVINTKKQVFLSVGHLSLEEVSIIHAFLKSENKTSTIMHSISKYPPSLAECNFPRMQNLKLICPDLGFSDHSIDELSTLTAIAYGAVYIEKHFKNCEDCLDAHFSLNEWEFEDLIRTSREYHKAIFSSIKDNARYARSIFAIKDIKEGDKFTLENVKIIRPNDGLHPMKIYQVLSSESLRDIERGEPLQESDIQI